METLKWTQVQIQRLKALGASDEIQATAGFHSRDERNRRFQEIEQSLVRRERARLEDYLENQLRPKICLLEHRLIETLNQHGFAQVTTPLIITRAALARMSITADNPLFKQIYWINANKCLRPMLAPNLYSLMMDLGRLRKRPLRFFEVGPCFRKETDGLQHTSEFTMLNLVEMGLSESTRHHRLREIGTVVCKAAGLTDFDFQKTSSDVYGDTIDIVAGKSKTEIASGAMGPHPLDAAWRIDETWIGFGFGIERLLMVSEGHGTMGRWRKSLSYLDGIRLNI